MPECKQRLPRDDPVEIIGDFYLFLVRMYIPESSLKFPPPGGWPSITPESTKAMKKKPFVIDLIKHLPYIDNTFQREMVTHINYKCDVIDYTDPRELNPSEAECPAGEFTLWQYIDDAKRARGEKHDAQSQSEMDLSADDSEGRLADGNESSQNDKEANIKQDDDHDGNVGEEEDDWDDGSYRPWEYIDVDTELDLSDCIPLATGYESDGRNFVLDVFNGTIYDESIGLSDHGQFDVVELLEKLQDKLERLEDVPLPNTQFEGLYTAGDFFENVPEADSFDAALTSDRKNYALQVKSIYRSYGWPGEDYDKTSALRAIADLQYRRAVAAKKQKERQKKPEQMGIICDKVDSHMVMD